MAPVLMKPSALVCRALEVAGMDGSGGFWRSGKLNRFDGCGSKVDGSVQPQGGSW